MTRNEKGIITDVTVEEMMAWHEVKMYFHGLDVQGEYENMFDKECPYDIETAQKIGKRAMEILGDDDSYWESYWIAFQDAINEAEEEANR